jgi:Mg/Co/Ni transporter MgtE
MGPEVTFLKSVRRIEPRNLTVGLLLGCFIVAFAYFSMTKFDSFHFYVGEFIISVAICSNFATLVSFFFPLLFSSFVPFVSVINALLFN